MITPDERKTAVRIDGWSVISHLQFQGGIGRHGRLAGLAPGHPKHNPDHPDHAKYARSGGRSEPTKEIITSSIEEASGRYVRTHSGTVYLLGRICPKYRRWLAKNVERPYDQREPLIVHQLPVTSQQLAAHFKDN